MKICVYSANFGNYRNEVSLNNLSNINFSKDIDYYFFTDMNIDIDSTICKWKVIKVPLLEDLDFINKYRHTAKKYKFCIPDILKSYDYVIWCDTKSFKKIKNLNFDKIKKLIKSKNKTIFFIKHHSRENTIQELKETLRRGYEQKDHVNKFKNKIKNIKFNSKLPDSTVIIRKIDEHTNKIFKKIYKNIIKNKLCRDQNIIQYVLYLMNSELNLYYFENIKDLKSSINNQIFESSTI